MLTEQVHTRLFTTTTTLISCYNHTADYATVNQSTTWSLLTAHYTMSGKNGATVSLPLTLPNAGQFS